MAITVSNSTNVIARRVLFARRFVRGTIMSLAGITIAAGAASLPKESPI
jgi:hypothetical protein